MLAPAGLAYVGSTRNEAWAALTLLALDRKEATDPEYVGLPMDQPRRRQALTILYRSPQVVTRSVDLARYAVGAIYGRRDSVPAEAAQDPTVLLYLLGGLRPVLPLFEEAARQAGSTASWRGKSTAGPASPAPWPPWASWGARRRRWRRLANWPAASLLPAGAGNGSTWRAPVTP